MRRRGRDPLDAARVGPWLPDEGLGTGRDGSKLFDLPPERYIITLAWAGSGLSWMGDMVVEEER